MNKEEIISLIDSSRLSRDYIKNPIKKITYHKYDYCPTKEDLRYLYLELNLSIEEIRIFLDSWSYLRIFSLCKEYGIVKDSKFKGLKRKQTKLEKYGNPNYVNTEKNKKTKLEKYGDENYNNREKFNNTCLEKYGVKGYNNREKCNQTKLEHFGNSKYNNRDKYKETCLEKFGFSNPCKNEEVKKKLSESVKENFKDIDSKERIVNQRSATYQKKTGFSHPSKNPEIKNKKLESFSKTITEKYGSKEEFFRKYIVNYEFPGEEFSEELLQEAIQRRQEKVYQTKKLHNTFNTSKPENIIYQLLLTKFPDTIHQYRSKEYPFNCDFYIPSLDTYIEYQGSWTHGGHPYNENNPEDTRLLEKWKEKSIASIYYKNAIKDWTIRDTKKRETAKKNNLNYLEFFNKEEFMDWFNKQ